jgi:hypothetical protein
MQSSRPDRPHSFLAVVVESSAALSLQTEAGRASCAMTLAQSRGTARCIVRRLLLRATGSSRCVRTGLENERISPGWLGLKSTALTGGRCPPFFPTYHIFNLSELVTLNFYGLVDSPVGLAVCDHDIRSYQMIARVFDGKPEGLTRDDVLDNVTLYWLTNTAISSARLYWDTRHNLPAGGFFDVRGITIPVGVSAFAEEIYQAPKSWAEKAYVKLVYYGNHPKGTHFAAWEQPTLFVSDVRATFKSLRS